MIYKFFLTAIFLMLIPTALAQETWNDEGGIYCNFHTTGSTVKPSKIYPPSKSAINAIYRITSQLQLSIKFKIYRSDIEYAQTHLKAGKPYLFYGEQFIQRLNIEKNDWAAIAIFAHELAHQLNGDTARKVGIGRQQELNADFFAGGAVRLLGGNLDSTITEYNKLPAPGPTHPKIFDRITSLKSGYKQKDEQLEQLFAQMQPETLESPLSPSVGFALSIYNENIGKSTYYLKQVLKRISLPELLTAAKFDSRAATLVGWGYRHAQGGLKHDISQAIRYWGIACEIKGSRACHNLASEYSSGDHILQDDGKSLSLLRRACDLGYTSSCVGVAITYYNGRGVLVDYEKAIPIFEDACEIDPSTLACGFLGNAYYFGDGVKQNLRLAADYYQRSCDIGEDKEACYNIGVMNNWGQGIEKNYTKANVYLKRICTFKNIEDCDQFRIINDKNVCAATDHPNACFDLGVNFLNGSGVSQNPGEASKYFFRACELGNTEGCKELKRVLTK